MRSIHFRRSILAGMLGLGCSTPDQGPNANAPEVFGDFDLQRRMLVFDLDEDGAVESFNRTELGGSHSACFALVAWNRVSLLNDGMELCGDRIVILTDAHHGYHDIITSDGDPWSTNEQLWTYGDERYSVTQTSTLDKSAPSAFIEETYGAALEAWYFDVYSTPNGG